MPAESGLDPGAAQIENQTTLDGDRTSWLIRSIQVLLAVILLLLVFDGLRRRAWTAEPRHERTKAALQDVRSHNTILAQSAPDATALSYAIEHRRSAPERSFPPLDEGLASFSDLAEYLELHRVAREARRYELGSAAPEALMHLATTSDHRRYSTHAHRDR